MNDDFDDDSSIDDIKTHVVHTIDKKRVVVHNDKQIFLMGEIEESHQYLELFNVLQKATKLDTIDIFINSPGGRCDTGFQICNAIERCLGKVITHADPSVCSVATDILLSGNSVVVYDNSSMMFHNYSGWYSGKGHEAEASLLFDKRYFGNAANAKYDNFLSKAELKAIVAGSDIYLDCEEIKDRLESVQSKNKMKSGEVKERLVGEIFNLR